MISEINDCKLMDVKLTKTDYGYGLQLTYEYCDDIGNVHERVINNVPLPLYNLLGNVTIRSLLSISVLHADEKSVIDVGYGEQYTRPDFKTIDRIVEYATKEMTIEEIEKKLGYKVKIVSGE